ncbi:MAG: hypothetical protein A2W91_17835 [Bacteroidetes bacterium GWF2_38_335]|nr:MAG: hypothetical protein A2W91_17835 [Bacteroidetes bacterium GWF2_38_335]OFY80166.1 MAG: hypothetical protein A2281_12805 [Bacteroidetes bacterium RIFOXYA12_FULL_38_20]HBS88505.1 hypothetical protein [Bacteroidales bacterium]
MPRLFKILLFLVLPLFAGANSASLRCLDVKSNGDVLLSWLEPTDVCGGFDSYEIYASADGIAFTLIQTITVQTTVSYLHVNANAHLGQRYYFIRTQSNCGIFNSDTLSTMYLELNNPGTGVAQMTWNNIHSPSLSTSSTNYSVYLENPTGIWTNTGSTAISTPSYSDTIYVCRKMISYYIELTDESGCISRSSSDGDIFENAIPPAIPVLDTVSVNMNTGDAYLGWFENTEPDIAGYIVFYYYASGSVFVDTVWGGAITSYIDDFGVSTDDASKKSVSYSVAAFDSCQNRSQFCDFHNTLYVFPYLDSCNRRIRVDWNDYVNWDSGVKEYQVYSKSESGNYSLYITVSGSESETFFTSVSDQVLYCFYIVAVSNDGQTSTSNYTCIFVNLPNNPDFMNADHASITYYNNVELSFTVDNNTSMRAFKILESDNYSGPWDTIARFGSGSSEISYSKYIDMEYELKYYKIIAENRCRQNIDSSNLSKNIILKVTSDENYKHYLTWTNYEAYKGGIDRYNIYRIVDHGSPQLVNFVTDATFEYVDDVSGFINPGSEGDFCYYVEAVETDLNPYGIKGKSISNMSCAAVKPYIFIPDAFTPNRDGKNDEFKPVLTFASNENYEMIIFDRWSGIVFQTNDRQEGWNGKTPGGKIAPEGVYVYYIKFVSAENQVIEKRGYFTLIVP